MNTALEWSPFTNPPKTLSSDGQTLVNDLHDVVEQTKLLLLTKNEGNLMQDFVWQTKTIGTGDAKKPNVPVNKDMATKQGNEALEGLRTLGQLLITNGQFRKLRTSCPVTSLPPLHRVTTDLHSQGCLGPSPRHGR